MQAAVVCMPILTLTMDNKTFIDKLARQLDMPAEAVQSLSDSLTRVITACALEMDTVAVPSFGNFEPKKRQERISVHPGSGKRLLVPPKMVLAFKPSAILKNRLRSSQSEEKGGEV